MNYDFVQVAESIQHVSKLCSDEDTSPSAAKWIQCQEYFASSLGLSDAEVIDFLVRCAKGGTGVKTKGTFTPNPAPYNVPIDVKDCGNVLGLKHEQLSRARTNIFTFRQALRSNGKTPISFKLQQDIVASVQGTHPKLIGEATKQRRWERWRDWAAGMGGEDFQCIDLPQIAREYSSVWNATISDESMEGDDAIPEDALSTIKAEIVSLLQAMGEIDSTNNSILRPRQSRRVRGDQPEHHTSNDTDRRTRAGRTAATDPARKRQRTAEAVVSSEASDNDTADGSSAEDDEVEVIDDTKYRLFDMTHLKKLIDQGRLEELGKLELLCFGVSDGKTRLSLPSARQRELTTQLDR